MARAANAERTPDANAEKRLRSESRLCEDGRRPARKRLEHIGDLPARCHSDAVLDEELFPSCVARQSTLCVSIVIALLYIFAAFTASSPVCKRSACTCSAAAHT